MVTIEFHNSTTYHKSRKFNQIFLGNLLVIFHAFFTASSKMLQTLLFWTYSNCRWSSAIFIWTLRTPLMCETVGSLLRVLDIIDFFSSEFVFSGNISWTFCHWAAAGVVGILQHLLKTIHATVCFVVVKYYFSFTVALSTALSSRYLEERSNTIFFN